MYLLTKYSHNILFKFLSYIPSYKPPGIIYISIYPGTKADTLSSSILTYIYTTNTPTHSYAHMCSYFCSRLTPISIMGEQAIDG